MVNIVMSITSLFQGRSKLTGVLCCVALLAACGGGGGGGGKTSVPSSVVQSSAASSASVMSSRASSLSVSSSNSSVSLVNLMGGAIQGTSLNIASFVSTLAGIAPGADGLGALARFSRPSGMVSDGTNLYVVDNDHNTIRKIVISTGAVTTLAGTVGLSGNADGTGSAALFNSPKGITTDGTNLYVADNGNQTIRKIVISTAAVTTLAGSKGSFFSTDGVGAAAGFNSPLGITTDGNNLYVSDNVSRTIRKIVISTGAVTTLAGTAGVIGSADGTGAAASFKYPSGITTDGINLYVADYENSTIRKIVISTGTVITLAGTAGIFGNADGIGAAASFSRPRGITTDGTNLYVADYDSSTIRKIVISTGAVTTLAGSAGNSGSTDGGGVAASFNYPQDITTDGTNLYVADTSNSIIRKIGISTSAVTTLAGSVSPSDSSGSPDGTGAAARFDYPSGLTTDGSNLYVADMVHGTIRKIVIPTGAVTTLAGMEGVYGSADGTGAAARFTYPQGITTDGTNLYVTEYDNNAIRKIVISTGVVTTLAGSAGNSGSTDPRGITSDGTNLYIADSGNQTIRKIVISTGEVTTLAGSAGNSGGTDGLGAAARFNSPLGITTDGTNLYVTDHDNNTIRKIVISTGAVTTLAGSASASDSFGHTDGTGAAARFGHPQGITTDGTNLYVVDFLNNTIRKIVISTGAVTTLAATAGVTGNADGVGAAASFNFPRDITTDGTSLYVSDTSNSTIRKIH